MNDERLQVALPKLYGAPAYARPPVVPVAPSDRPFDPDDLPLEAQQTREERELAASVVGPPSAAAAGRSEAGGGKHGPWPLRRSVFRLRVPRRSGGAQPGD